MLTLEGLLQKGRETRPDWLGLRTLAWRLEVQGGPKYAETMGRIRGQRRQIASMQLAIKSPKVTALRKLAHATAGAKRGESLPILLVDGEGMPVVSGTRAMWLDDKGAEVRSCNAARAAGWKMLHVESTRSITVGVEWVIAHFGAM